MDTAEGRSLTITFDGKRCIHARFCVLGAPAVFKANTPGEWIFPERIQMWTTVLSRAYKTDISFQRFCISDGGVSSTSSLMNQVKPNGSATSPCLQP